MALRLFSGVLHCKWLPLQEAPGTMIGNFKTDPDAPAGHFVRGFATIDDVSLINVEVLNK